MYRKSLASEIDITELQTMRQNGMTNRQIADNIGVSQNTVYRYLGKQPAMLRATPGTYSAAVQKKKEEGNITVLPAPAKPGKLRIIAQTSIVAGKYHQYTISLPGCVTIAGSDNGNGLKLAKKDMEEYITELMEVYAMMTNEG